MVHDIQMNRIGGVVVSVLASSVVDLGSSTGLVKPKSIKLVFAASPLSTQLSWVRANTGLLGIRIMCKSGVTCLSADCSLSTMIKSNSECLSRTRRTSASSYPNVTCSRYARQIAPWAL